MDQTSPRTGTTATLPAPRPAPPAPAQREPTSPRRKGEARVAPARDATYRGLTLDGLRAYRSALTDEETKVAYWRRIIKARREVVQGGAHGRPLDIARLSPVLTNARVDLGRQALLRVLPDDDMPPLPRLAELWERPVDPTDEPGRSALEQDLLTAEAALAAYGSTLHDRIHQAAGELIARYHEQPVLCLSALPVPPPRRDVDRPARMGAPRAER